MAPKEISKTTIMLISESRSLNISNSTIIEHSTNEHKGIQVIPTREYKQMEILYFSILVVKNGHDINMEQKRVGPFRENKITN